MVTLFIALVKRSGRVMRHGRERNTHYYCDRGVQEGITEEGVSIYWVLRLGTILLRFLLRHRWRVDQGPSPDLWESLPASIKFGVEPQIKIAVH